MVIKLHFDWIEILKIFFFFFKELRIENEEKGFDLDSYVDVVRNTLKLKKNLCIAKRFNILKKEELLKGRSFYIDVWPVCFHNTLS
jgi:hypothetical protein